MPIKSVKPDKGTFKVENDDGDVFTFISSAVGGKTLELLGTPIWSSEAEPTDAAERIDASRKAALEEAPRETDAQP